MEFNQIIEEWRTIPNFPDYIISNLGKIKRTTTQGRWKAGHLIKFGTNGKYPMVLLFSQDHRKPRYIHRLLLEAFIGPCPDGKNAIIKMVTGKIILYQILNGLQNQKMDFMPIVQD